MFSRLFLSFVFLGFTLTVAGRGKEEITIDSLNDAALSACDTSYQVALSLLHKAHGLAEQAGYAHGVLESTCLQSIIWSNSNRCSDAFYSLRRLSPRETSVNPLRYYGALGTCWYNYGNYDSARRYHERALETTVPGRQLREYNYERIQLARTYVKTGLQEQALEYYDGAARYFSSSGDSAGIALCEDVAGEIFYTQRLYQKAGIHLLRSCSIFHRLRNYPGEAAALLYLGNNYYMRVMDDSARGCYRAALSCCTRLGDSAGMAFCYSNLSRIYLEGNDTKAAVAYALKALSAIRPGNYIALEAGTYQQLGDIYGELRQYDVSDPMKPRLAGSVHAGGIARKTALPDGQFFGGGPQMTEISRDGRRVYFTNSLYSSLDRQFYPAGIPGRQVMCNVGDNGGITLDERFVVDFGPEYGAHQVRLQGGDCSTDSFCFPSA